MMNTNEDIASMRRIGAIFAKHRNMLCFDRFPSSLYLVAVLFKRFLSIPFPDGCTFLLDSSPNRREGCAPICAVVLFIGLFGFVEFWLIKMIIANSNNAPTTNPRHTRRYIPSLFNSDADGLSDYSMQL